MSLRYYCQAKSDRRDAITDLLQNIEKKHGISFEIRDLGGDPALEREACEQDFKPVARLLKKRTGSKLGIRELRGRRSGIYYVSLPGTIAIVSGGMVQWYTLGASNILEFLMETLTNGEVALTARSEN
jgi:hypothetical protein